MTASHPASMIKGRSVLVVEDQYLIADELSSLVERLGGTVIGPLPRVAVALAALDAATPDFALLDVNLDGESIYAVASVLRARGVPFALVTGYDRNAIAPAFRDAPYIEKPVAQASVTRLFRQWLQA